MKQSNRKTEARNTGGVILLERKEEKLRKTAKAFVKEDLPIILSIISMVLAIFATMINSSNLALQEKRYAMDINAVKPELLVSYMWLDYQAFNREDAVAELAAKMKNILYQNESIMRFSELGSDEIEKELDISGFEEAKVLFAVVGLAGEKPVENVSVEITRSTFSETINVPYNQIYDFVEQNKRNAANSDMTICLNTIDKEVLLYIPIMFRCSTGGEDYIYQEVFIPNKLSYYDTMTAQEYDLPIRPMSSEIMLYYAADATD